MTQYHESAPSTETCPFGQPLVACENANNKANAITNIAISAMMTRPIGLMDMRTKQMKSTTAAEFIRQTGPTGAVEIYVVRPRQILRGVLDGDLKVARFAQIIEQSISQIVEKKRPPLCLLCDTQFGHSRPLPAAFVITVPFLCDWIAGESVAVASGVCRKCATEKSDNEIGQGAMRLLAAREIPTGSA